MVGIFGTGRSSLADLLTDMPGITGATMQAQRGSLAEALTRSRLSDAGVACPDDLVSGLFGEGLGALAAERRNHFPALGVLGTYEDRSEREKVAAVWSKATYVDAENEARGFRKDPHHAWIRYQDHGDRRSPWGWESDHAMSKARGGTDHISNLQPLHWRNNLAKSDGRAVREVWAEGIENVEAFGLFGSTPISK